MSESATIRDALIAWYAAEKRDLPWRNTSDPYAIWLSEIMLQQTRVDTVIPYFERFMARFPTIRDLAAADLEELLMAWSGLGYYRRARSLHLAANEVVLHHGGALPASKERLLQLPGIGPYTAGAIASIAFGERAAIVDGNVTRVLARVHGIEEDVTDGAVKRRIWRLAEALVPADEPGELNQALMDLGATVCTPRRPQCSTCPISSHCRAHRLGVAETLPRARAKPRPREVELVAVVASCGRAPDVLLARRRPEGLFGGLWEPPMVAATLPLEAQSPARPLGVSARAKLDTVGSVRHVLTHRIMHVQVSSSQPRRRWKLPAASTVAASDSYAEMAWKRPESVPLSTLARKILRLVLASAVLLGASRDVLARDSEGQQTEPRFPADDTPAEESDDIDGVSRADLEHYARLDRERGGYARVFGTLSGGRGLRFNNPFRLSDQLGAGAESVSATAPYFDMSANVTFGDPNGLQHGGAVHFAVALQGVGQQAFSFSYLMLHRGRSPLMLYGRLGVSLLTAPDFNAGAELAFGAAYFFTGGVGVTSELVGNLFYGAGTYEVAVTTIPVVSAQGGLIFDFEVLP